MRLGFIGTGKIASSVITGICNSKISFKKILVSPRNRNIAQRLKRRFRKVSIAKTNQEIINKLTAIESLLEATHQVKPRTLVEAAKFLDLSPSHLYKLTSERKIPHFKPNGKKIYFDESELVQWLKRKPTRTLEETEEKAASYIVSGKGSV